MKGEVLTIEDGVLTRCDDEAVDIMIPDGVTEIGERAFYCCKSLKSVVIPDSVQLIEFLAFANCIALESVVIGKNVSCIKNAAFKECESLKSIDISDCKMSSIAEEAFKGCSSLESVKLPKELDEIGYHSFEECKSLKSIDIPLSVTKISFDAFLGCSSLEAVVIPDGVSWINMDSFSDCKSLKSLVIGKGVRIIDRWSFRRCKSLTEVEFRGTLEEWEKVEGRTFLLLPTPVKSVKCADGEWKRPVLMISEGVVIACVDDSGKAITVPEGVTKIDYSAFSYCTSLESVVISEGVDVIRDTAFEGCTSLKYIELPSTLRYIGSHVFEGCCAVEKIVSKSEKFPFNEKTGKLYDTRGSKKKVILVLAKQTAKEEKIGQVEKVSATAVLDSIISEHSAQTTTAHVEDKSYLRIKASDSGVEILLVDSRIAKWSKALPALLEFAATGADAASIRKYALENGFEDASRKFLTITNEGVTKIKKYAKPVYLALPEGVTEVRIKPYSIQQSLEAVLLPSSVTLICKGAFYGCTLLSEIKFAGTVEQWNAIKKGKEWSKDVGTKCVKCTDGEVSLTEKEVLKSKMKAIRRQLSANEEVNKVAQTQNSEASEALDSIIDTHKLKASFLRRGDSLYLRINAGKGGIEIYLSDSDLSKWSKTLPALLDFAETESDASALRKYALDNGFMDASQKYFSLINGCVNGNDNKNPAYLFIGDGAKTIEKNAFGMCQLLKTIVIASGLRKIENYAFSYCRELESIEIPETVTEIGNMAFFGCISLETILFGGTVAQWKALTEKKESLLVFSPVKSVKCSDGECKKPVHLVVKYTGKEEQGVSLGYDVTRIPEDFFAEQKSVEYVIVPEGITEIGARAFKNCDVQTVLLPLTLTKIDDSAFEGCTNLTFVRVQLGLKKIGERAFFGCKSLCAVWFYGSEKLWHTIEKGADWCEGTKIKNIECFGLDSLTIENGVVTECKKDAVVVRLPRNTAKISNGAFKDCVCLKYVAFYSGLTEIGNNAFQNCTALDTIVFDGKLSQWEEEVKKGTDWNKNVPAKVVHCKYGDSRI